MDELLHSHIPEDASDTIKSIMETYMTAPVNVLTTMAKNIMGDYSTQLGGYLDAVNKFGGVTFEKEDKIHLILKDTDVGTRELDSAITNHFGGVINYTTHVNSLTVETFNPECVFKYKSGWVSTYFEKL